MEGNSGAASNSGRTNSSRGRANSRSFARGGRGGGRGGHQGKKRDLGRSQYAKQKVNRGPPNLAAQAAKRQKLADDGKGLPVYATKFSEEELKDEERRPKKKVAVLIGYSGTGYKGMQLAPDQKTIEGDLFKAFVAAGAISKANADDPKKSSFVRCARTDKGVHAAGNVISLKLIVEDEDIVQKINDNLTSQIRVWGFERTSNSFSAYQMVDSRIYEYLIPTHSFLPPHPRSYLGRKCEEWAEKKGELDTWESRQREVDGFWEKIDEEQIKPILADYDDDVRNILEKALWLRADEELAGEHEEGVNKPESKIAETNGTVEPAEVISTTENGTVEEQKTSKPESVEPASTVDATTMEENESGTAEPVSISATEGMTIEEKRARTAMINEGIKKLRQVYIGAKRAYRIDSTRLQRIREALETYVGTRNYHNYTVAKSYNDPSAKRVIKSFVVHGEPLLINNTEWLSLKVHGQSFMMHQIRKMVGMAALVVRCGCDPQRIVESYGKANISIPKAPSLGLLLERPIFDSYNKKAKSELSKDAIDFKKYESTMDEFKQKEIYDRMHADEERENTFNNFFNHVDNFPSETFLFVTSGGIEATKTSDKHAIDPASKEKLRLVDADVGNGEVDSDAEPDVGDGAGNEG